MSTDDPLKKLLVRLKLDTSEFGKTIQSIKSQLKEMNETSRRDAAAATAEARKHSVIVKQEIDDQRRLQAEAKTMLAVDQAKAQWQKKNQEAIKTTIQQRVLETAEMKKQQLSTTNMIKLEQERLRLAQQQYRIMQQQTRDQERQQSKLAQGGGLGVFGKVISSVAGGGLIGSIAGGALLGAGFERALEVIVERFRELGRALVEATGPAAQLREQFEKLTLRSGASPDEFLTKLRVATRGLAADTDLYRISNNFMQQGLHVSNESIVKLIRATIDLSRAQGKDATQAMQALIRASLTGRTMTLAYVTGLTRQELALRGISQAVDPVTRNTMQFNQVLAAMEGRLKAVGTPATTLPELFQKFSRVMKNWREDIAISITKSVGFHKAIDALSQALDLLEPILGKVARAIGQLGDVLEVVVPAAKLFVDSINLIGTTISSIDRVANAFERLSHSTKGFFDKLTSFQQFVVSLSLGLQTVDQFVVESTLKMKGYALIAEAVLHGNFYKVSKLRDQMDAEIATSRAQAAREAADILTTFTRHEKTKPAGPQHDIDLNVAKDRQLQRLTLQIEEETNKLRLEMRLEGLKAEQQAVQQAYEQGFISLKEQVDRERRLDAQEHQAKMEEIEAERQAKIQNIRATGRISGTPADIVTKQEETANLAARLKREQENTQNQQREFTRTQTLLHDQQAAYLAYVDAINKINLDGVKTRTSDLEEEFKEGRVQTEDYIAQRKDLIEEEYTLTVQGLNERLEANKNNASERAKIEGELANAQISKEKEMTKLILSEDDIRIQSLQFRYEQAKKFVDMELSIAKSTRGGEAQFRQVYTLQTQYELAANYISQLQDQQADLEARGGAYTKDWIKINEQIAQATDEEQKLNLQLAQAKDLAAPLSGMFGQLSGILERFRGRGAQEIGELFQGMQGSLETLSKFSMGVAQYGGGGGLLGNIATSFKSLFHPNDRSNVGGVRRTAQQMFEDGLAKSAGSMDHLTDVVRELTRALMDMRNSIQKEGIETEASNLPLSGRRKLPSFQSGGIVPGTGPQLVVAHGGEQIGQPDVSGLGIGRVDTSPLQAFNKMLADTVKIPFTAKLHNFVDGLSTAFEGVKGFAQGVTGAKSGAGGALSGAMSGMNLGSAAGPYGMIAGAVVGGIMGGIFGAKEKQLMQDMHKIQDQMQSIIDSMNEGAITLSQAIQDLRKEREQAIQILSQDPKGGKGGGKGGKKGYTPSQAQSLINQIDQQIGQLVNEQQQLLSQLDQQVAIFASPAPFQQYVQSLDQIIEKYQQFASAASGNAQAVANAQTYLNESLQAYVVTLSQQLNQAQQQAIQDSLTLLNLEYQRQQIINQEAQQEYDILTQGVLTRQRTTAMTKGQQIGQLRYERDMQLQQIDEQIALQQYKVQTEQQIFNMATTRIGLEMQLLSLQEQQAGVQNQNTAALLQVVQQLQGAMASGSLMNQITALNAGGPATGTGLLTTLMGSLGLGGYVPPSVLTGVGGATNYLSQIPQQYQSITNFINNMDPNFLMNLWQAMQTPAGSAQRQSAVAEASPYADDANTSGYDFNSFASWIQSGAQITGTTATVTNAPVATGPSTLPGGTAFPMPTGTGYAPSSIPGYTGGTGTSPYNAVAGEPTPYDQTASSMANLNTNTISAAQALQNFATVVQGINVGYANAKAGGIPTYQSGGPVAETGPIMAHEGEWVLPKPIVSVLRMLGSNPSSPAMPASGSYADNGSVAVHSSLLDMTSKRTNMEMTVINARQSQLIVEMQHLKVLNDTIQRIAQLPGGSLTGGSLESMLNQVYETRGRYGSGNFRREYL